MEKAKEKVQTCEPKQKKSSKLKNEVANAMPAPTPLDKKIYKSLTTSISRELSKVEASYLKVAITLYMIHDGKLYTVDNFNNIYDFAADMFSLSRGTVNNFINIVDSFCISLPDGSFELRDRFKDFTSSQLVCLLKMPKQFIDSITPDMSVRAIKDKRREYKALMEDTANSDIIDVDSHEISDTESEPDSKQPNQTKQEKMQNPCFIFETSDYSDFWDQENVAVIDDALKDFKNRTTERKFDSACIWKFKGGVHMALKVILVSGDSHFLENVYSVNYNNDSVQILYGSDIPNLNRIQCAIFEYKCVASITCF